MSNSNQLGNNIRALRRAYGETQEQLGQVISPETAKNVISNYETGNREPDKEILARIAEHYMVTLDELIHGDFSGIGKIALDSDILFKNMGLFFPIVSSKKALTNTRFNKAIDAHKASYSEMRLSFETGLDIYMDVCFKEYWDLINVEETQTVVCANFLPFWFLMLGTSKGIDFVKKKPTAAIKQVASQDDAFRKTIENLDETDDDDFKAFIDRNKNKYNQMICDMLSVLKHSKSLSDLADYYMALQFVFNIVDNDLGWAMNLRIGSEMMSTFAMVDNKYASRFCRFSQNSLR